MPDKLLKLDKEDNVSSSHQRLQQQDSMKQPPCIS